MKTSIINILRVCILSAVMSSAIAETGAKKTPEEIKRDLLKQSLEAKALYSRVGKYRIGHMVLGAKVSSKQKEDYLKLIAHEKKSLAYFRQYLNKDTTIDRSDQARRLIGIADMYRAIENFPQALAYYQQALDFGGSNKQSKILNAMGLVHEQANELPLALQYYQQALSIHRKCCDTYARLPIINSLNKVANIYCKLNNYPKGIEHYQEVVRIQRLTKHAEGEKKSLEMIAEIYATKLNNYPKAIEYYQQSLSIQRNVSPQNPYRISLTLKKISDLYAQLGQKGKSTEYLKLANEANEQHLEQYAKEVAKLNANPSRASIERARKKEAATKLLAETAADSDRVMQRHSMRRLSSEATKAKLARDYELAIEKNQQALKIADNLKEDLAYYFLEQLIYLNYQLNRETKAKQYYKQLQKRSNDTDTYAEVIDSLTNPKGDNFAGTYVPVVKDMKKKLEYLRKERQPMMVANGILGKGRDLFNRGRYFEAIRYFEKSLKAFRLIEDGVYGSDGESRSLNALGNVYLRLGMFDKAHTYFQKVLFIWQKYDYPVGVADSLNHLGNVSFAQKKFSEAQQYYQQSLTISQEALHLTGGSHSLNNLGLIFMRKRQYTNAQQHFQKALEMERLIGDSVNKVKVLNNLGKVNLKLGHDQNANRFFLTALSLGEKMNTPESVWQSWAGLAESFSRAGQSETTVLAGKQAVNVLQTIRANNINLDQHLQKSYLADKEHVYRNLASALIEQGRLAEAEQVMAMLKEDEYFDFIQRDGKEDGRTTKASFTVAEKKIIDELKQYNLRLSKLSTQYEALIKQSKTDRSKTKPLAEMEAKLARSNADYLALLSRLKARTNNSGKAEKIAINVARAQNQQRLLKNINAVLITTVITEDKLHLILTTPKGQVARQSVIEEKQLNVLVQKFRGALKHSGSDPKPLAQALYTHLLKPLEKDIKLAGVQTLMWSLDGTLRYIPLAALHDGNQYLVERFNLSLYTAAAHNDFSANNNKAWRVAGFGVSKKHPGFVALPAVPQELESIIRKNKGDRDGVVPGKIYLDQLFNRNSLKGALANKYPVLHIASHFKLKPGDSIASKLLLGNGNTISLDEFRRQKDYNLYGVDLLTLSACETAVAGNGEGSEVESFAVMAQMKGTKSVLASLWKIEDESTGKLMKQLYKLRGEDSRLSKSEALRLAQLMLLRGEIKTDHDFSHPRFWAPFVLMGNWL